MSDAAGLFRAHEFRVATAFNRTPFFRSLVTAQKSVRRKLA